MATYSVRRSNEARPGPFRHRLNALRGGLSASREGLEQAAVLRIADLQDGCQIEDLEYFQEMRRAIAAAVDLGLASLESDEAERAVVLPDILRQQTRRSAREGVPVDTVLRHYVAGYTLFGDFVSREAAQVGFASEELQRIMAKLGRRFDLLLAAVAEEHARAIEVGARDPEARRVEKLERLLRGELLEVGEFNYDFADHHVAVVAAGEESPEVLRHLATALDRRLLSVCRPDETLWGWLGGRSPLAPDELRIAAGTASAREALLAFGEPTRGVSGWQLSHRQATAAFAVTRRDPEFRLQGTIFYAEVALLASALRDDLLSTSLRNTFLLPLEQGRDEGAAARETLRAYFALERNVSSTAASLGVSRRTVTNRLRSIEERLGRSLGSVGPEIEVALKLDVLAEGSR